MLAGRVGTEYAGASSGLLLGATGARLRHTGRVPPTPYDAIASEYYEAIHQTSRNFDAATRTGLAARRPDIPPGVVLEVGAGRGRATEFLGIDSGRVVQLDNSTAMLDLEPREDAYLRVLHDAEQLPFPHGEFSAVLGFLCDPFLGLNFLTEARRVLKDGGILILTTPSHRWGSALRQSLDVDAMETRFVLKNREVVKVPSALYPVSQLLQMLEAAGFEPSNTQARSLTLPEDVVPVSADIAVPAARLGLPVHELEIVDLIEAWV